MRSQSVVDCSQKLHICARCDAAISEEWNKTHKHTSRLASARTYLDGDVTRRNLPKTAPLLLWLVGAIAVFLLFRTQGAPLPVAIWSSDPETESH